MKIELEIHCYLYSGEQTEGKEEDVGFVIKRWISHVCCTSYTVICSDNMAT